MILLAALIIFLGLQLPAGLLFGRFLRFSHPQVFPMSTPNPVPAAPDFWHVLGAALKHTLIADGIAPLRAGLAAFKAAKADPIKASLALAQQQVALAQEAPLLAGDIEGDVIDAMDALLAKAQASAPAAAATPAS